MRILKPFVSLLLAWSISFFVFILTVPKTIDFNTQTDAIVVFTGSKGRVAEAVRLYEAHLAPRLFISGVRSKTSEKMLFQQYIPGTSLKDADNIDFGFAKNTRQNALETAEWVKENKVTTVRLVTASYHMPRSLIEFSYRAPGVRIIPHPIDEPLLRDQKTFLLYVSEFHKTVSIIIKHLINSTT